MKPSLGSWLVLLGLVCSVFSEPATCEQAQENEFQLVNAPVGGHAHGFKTSPSSAALQPAITSPQDELSEEVWKATATGNPNVHDRKMRPDTELGLQSGGKNVSKLSSRRGGFLPESNPRTNKASRVSRVLLQQSGQPSCPVDFQFMRNFPSYDQSCQDFNPGNVSNSCCNQLNSSIGQARSEYLRISGEFGFENVATVGDCIANLASELHSLDNSLSSLITPTCFPTSNYAEFVTNPSACEGIKTRADFENLVGVDMIKSSINQSCSNNSNLLSYPVCATCVDDMRSVITILSSISPNNSECLYYTLFYAAGISNLAGPYDQAAAQCILALNPPQQKGGGAKDLALKIGIGAAAAFGASLIAFVVFLVWWRRRRGKARREFIERNMQLLNPAMRPNTGLIKYSFEEIKAATNSFSAKNYIGSGGFGDVYYGLLDDGLQVAVKRMKNCSPDGDADFLNEVTVINSVRHRNLVILRGCCVASTESDGHQRLLIYDYMPNGSLQDYLFGKKTPKPFLEWTDRRRLAIGMAKGIDYLHSNARPPIIHRDIKASNVLLDENLNAKVADFGLAKFSVEGQTQVDTAVAGTLGYVAPEYPLYGQLTEESDVYSFGVVLLELMSGRSAIDGVLGNSLLITDWAWGKINEGKPIMDIVDEKIRNGGPRDVMERFVLVAILCSHMLVAFRPTMEEALKYLEGDFPLPDIPNRPLPVNRDLQLDYEEVPLDYTPRPFVFSTSSRRRPNRTTPSGHSVAAFDALSEEQESEHQKLYKAQMAAMSEFSGGSAGVPENSLLR